MDNDTLSARQLAFERIAVGNGASKFRDAPIARLNGRDAHEYKKCVLCTLRGLAAKRGRKTANSTRTNRRHRISASRSLTI